MHVLAFRCRNGAAAADEHAEERALAAAEDAADDRATAEPAPMRPISPFMPSLSSACVTVPRSG